MGGKSQLPHRGRKGKEDSMANEWLSFLSSLVMDSASEPEAHR